MKRTALLLALLLSLSWAGAAHGAVPTQADSGLASPSTERGAAIAPLRVPKLGITGASIIPVGVDAGGHLAVGPSVRSVYTWRDGVRPGQRGSAVIAGHTWSKGAGVFDRLGSMKVRDRFSVGRANFKVTSVERVRSMSSKRVRELFSDRGPARVVLITCGDRSAATGVYASRILVYAKKVHPKKK